MPKAMGANALCGKGRQGLTRFIDRAADEAIYAKARQRFFTTVEKDELLGGTSSDKRFEHVGGALPNGAQASLVAFPNQAHRGRVAPTDVINDEVRSFIYARASVVEEQQ
jgi:hypothetical protein